MESGFCTIKDLLDVLIIPITLAILAVLFPVIRSWHIRRRFKKLILRELKEIGPYPTEKMDSNDSWISHQTKKCVHKDIFINPSDNRDFILSLPPDLVYYLTNLWDPKNGKDISGAQWKHYLRKLKEYFNDSELNEVYRDWEKLIQQYQVDNIIPIFKCKEP